MTTLDVTLLVALIWAECFDCAGSRALKRWRPRWALALVVLLATLGALRLFAFAVMP